MEISDEKLELFAGMEPIDAVDKTVKSMAASLLSTRADLAAAREELAKYRWIPVGERLPEDYKLVLFYDIATGEISLGSHVKQFKQWTSTRNMFYHGGNYDWITHWMPLPLPPKEGEG